MQYKRCFYIILMLCCLSVINCFYNNLLLAASIRNYTIAPLNRLTVYFDKLPETISEVQADDKKSISIDLGNVSFQNVQTSTTSAGIIKSTELHQSDNTTKLVVQLTEPRGYTISKLPWSQALLVEVFDWSKLNTAEDAYRTGLLSLIDNVNDLAAVDLLNAVNGDIADASFFLGLINLQQGKINTANKLFRFAEIKSTSINDNFAALAQIHSYKKENDIAENYNKIYESKLPENLSIIPTPVDFSNVSEQNEIAENIPHLDSVLATNTVSQVPQTQAITDSSKLQKDSTKKDSAMSKPKETSIWEAENYLLLKYVAGIAIAAVLLVVYLYLKWRNKRMLALAKKNKDTVATADASKITSNQQKFSKVINEVQNKETTTQQPGNANTKTPVVSSKDEGNAFPIPSQMKGKQTNNKSVSEMLVANAKNPAQHKSESVANYKKNADNLLSLIDNMKSEDIIKSDSILKSEAGVSAPAGGSALNTSLKGKGLALSPNVELATRLVNEQKRIQQAKLAKLDTTSSIVPEKLNDIARRIGIDKGSIETKQNLENLIKNEQEFEKLSEKFGIRKK